MRDVLTAAGCPGFALRRLHAGELAGAEAEVVRAHSAACARCSSTLAGLDAERDLMREALPFEAFARGVESRVPRVRAESARATVERRRSWAAPARWVPVALAASVAVVVAVPLLRGDGGTRVKGAASASLIVGGSSAPREAIDGELLAAGERVRVRVVPGEHRFVLALSVDEAGEVSVLYDEQGKSLAVEPGAPQVLPDSVAFDGPGAERVYVVLSGAPIPSLDAVRAARSELARQGSVARMGPLDGLPGEQMTRLLRKPGP